MDRLSIAEALPNFTISLQSDRFCNFQHKRYKGIVLRLQDGVLRSLHERAFRCRTVRNIDNVKKLSVVVETYVKKLDGLVRANHAKLEAMEYVLKWTSTIDQASAKKIHKLLGTVPSTKVLYRGMRLDKPKSVNLEYSSWTLDLKTAIRFSKGSYTSGEGDYAIVYRIPKNTQIVDLRSFITPSLLLLAEVGYFEGEPGTLYFDEIICPPIKLDYTDIVEVRKNTGSGFRKIKWNGND